MSDDPMMGLGLNVPLGVEALPDPDPALGPLDPGAYPRIECAMPRKETFWTDALSEFARSATLSDYLETAAECFEEYAALLREVARGERRAAAFGDAVARVRAREGK